MTTGPAANTVELDPSLMVRAYKGAERGGASVSPPRRRGPQAVRTKLASTTAPGAEANDSPCPNARGHRR